MESIEIIIAILYFILGAIAGSFLNVLSLRYNTGRGIAGRSACFSCGKKLVWHELIPIFSFTAQRGRCGNCGSKLSLQYPIIEFFTGLVFFGIFLKLSGLLIFSFPIFVIHSLFLIIVFSILIVILIYDFWHKIIPNGLVYSFITLVFVSLFVDFSALQVITPSFYGLLAGPTIALFFFLLWLISRGRWIGLGDAKLAAGIGWFLGISDGASAVMLAIWLGALVGISILFFRGKTFTMKGENEIPFGPFLIIGLLLVFFFNINILSFIL